MRRPSLLATAALLAALAAPATGRADEPPRDALAENLAQLRSDVEKLAEELSLKEVELRELTKAETQRKAELEGERQRERLRVERLKQEEGRLVERQQKEAEAEAALVPTLEKGLDALDAYIARGLPFRRAERRQEVEGLRQQLKTRETTPRQGLLRLWSLLQDELKLTRENGLYKQSIALGEQEVLADVVRIGMVGLYFVAPDGRVGRAVPRGEDWQYVELSGEEDQKRVLALVDAFKKQIRAGYFELPLGAEALR